MDGEDMALAQPAATDETLAQRSAAGDREAFAALYARHFDGLYDLAYRMLRTEDAAADVAQDTFTRAWDAFGRGKVPNNVKAWLFTVARNRAIDEIRHRGREVPESPQRSGDDTPVSALANLDAGPGGDPVERTRDRELAALVWEAAAALNPKEYSILDLHLRRGLSPSDIADHLKMSKGAAHTMLSRLRDSLEESVTATLLARAGGRDCTELDDIVGRTRSEGPRELRRAIHGHVEGCDRCEDTRRWLVSPSQIFAGLTLVPAPALLREKTWSELTAHVEAGRSNRRRAQRTVRTVVLVASIALIGGGSIAATRTTPSVGVNDPVLAGVSHEPGVPSRDNTVEVSMRDPDPRAGAHSTLWARDPALEPDETPEELGDRIVSPPLADGDWWLKVRTREAPEDGRWTTTAQIGPFLIRDASRAGPVRLTCGALRTIDAWREQIRLDVERGVDTRIEVIARPIGEGRAIWDTYLAGTPLTLSFDGARLGSGRARAGRPFRVVTRWPFADGALELAHGSTRFAWRICEHRRAELTLQSGPVGGFVTASAIATVDAMRYRPYGWIAAAAGVLLLCWILQSARRAARP